MGALVALSLATPALAHSPGCRTRRCDTHAYHLWLKHHPFTGYVVRGRTSTFGWPLEGGASGGITADGGTTRRPCIAIRNDRTLGHWFEVYLARRQARLLDCDWGPASWTGRTIDITGRGVEQLGFSPASYPTGTFAVARELR